MYLIRQMSAALSVALFDMLPI